LSFTQKSTELNTISTSHKLIMLSAISNKY